MASYAIGDIQGCFDTFMKLLEHINFDAERDDLILLGDIINRGPKSLEMLRYIINNQKNIKIILGNHEIYALALYYNALPEKKSHSLEALLEAPDSAELFDFLRQQPLIIKRDNLIFVHAGLYPDFSMEEIIEHNKSLQKKLRSNEITSFLGDYFAMHVFDLKALGSEQKNYFALAAFTLMRALCSQKIIDLTFSATLSQMPAFLKPWFISNARAGYKIFFGHWAALGFYNYKNYYCLDSGCGWGRALSALCLEDFRLFQVDNCDIS